MKNITKQGNIVKLVAFAVLFLIVVPNNWVLAISRTDAENAVRAAYQQCLGRSADSAGLKHHVDIILAGKSANEVKQDICKSEEALNYKNKGASNSSSSNSSNYSSNNSHSFSPTPRPQCSLNAGSGDVLINFETSFGLRADMDLAKSRKNGYGNIPAGIYNIRIMTWDAHSVHGGQNQRNEQAILNILNSNGGTIYTTSKTQDIPENKDIVISDIAYNANISSDATGVLAYHPEYPSSNPESLVPICVLFDKVSSTNPPTPPTPPNPTPNDFDIDCRVSDTRVEEGDDVRFEVDIEGGDAPYDIEWYNDAYDIDNFDLNDRDQIVRMNDEGRYYVSVRVTDDDGRTRTDACPVVVAEEEDDDDDLDVQCEISDSTIEEGDRVTIEVDIDGGDGPYDIQWSGDDDEIDDFDDNDRSQRVRIDDEGTYRLRVTVEDDDGNEDSDTCTIRVRDEDDDDEDINVFTNTNDTPTGDLAGLSSVYLNQVPYTGPEDTLKILGFISLILIWSGAIAYYLLKDRKKKKVSTNIQAFKEANRARLNI
jgi:hypothetical protein